MFGVLTLIAEQTIAPNTTHILLCWNQEKLMNTYFVQLFAFTAELTIKILKPLVM